MEIRPYEGFGPIDFGMTRDQVRARLPEPEDKLDYIIDREILFVKFDSTGRCYWVASSDDSLEPVVRGIPLLSPFDGVLDALADAGYTLFTGVGVIDGWLRCDELGLRITREDSDTQEIEAVCAYARSFSDDMTGAWVPYDG